MIKAYRPAINDKILKSATKYFTEALSSGNILFGDNVKEIERRISEIIGVNHCIMFNSATTAIYSVINFDSQRAITIPAINFVSLQDMAFALDKEVFYEHRDETLIGNTIPYYGSTWHTPLGGSVSRAFKVMNDEYVDGSQAFLCKDAFGNMIGSKGKATVFSFTFNKLLSAGEGGCVVTNDDELAKDLRAFRDHQRTEDRTVGAGGTNFRPNELGCSLLLAQLENLDYIKESLKKSHLLYRESIDDILVGGSCNHTRVMVKLPEGIDRDQVLSELLEAEIECPTPVMSFSASRLYGNEDEEIEDYEWDRYICLPQYMDISEDDVNAVCVEYNKIISKLKEAK